VTKSLTPAIVVTNNGAAPVLVTYKPTVTHSSTPAVTNVKASTNLTVSYGL
jgi:hypothetical protein